MLSIISYLLTVILIILAIFLLTSVIFVVLAVTGNFLPDYDIAGYLKTHPPISDEEFVQLCGPDTNAEIALKVRRIIAEISCIEETQIYPDARLIRDLGLE